MTTEMTPTTNRRSNLARSSVVIVPLLSLLIAACGGADASPPAKSPPAADSKMDADTKPEPRSVAEAQEQIASLRVELEGKPGDEKAPAPVAPTSPESSSPTKKSPEPNKKGVPPAGGATSREERSATGAEDVCGSPCRALASMKRAVDALCRMTGDTDTRCVDAKKTLTDSTTRVASCKCQTH